MRSAGTAKLCLNKIVTCWTTVIYFCPSYILKPTHSWHIFERPSFFVEIEAQRTLQLLGYLLYYPNSQLAISQSQAMSQLSADPISHNIVSYDWDIILTWLNLGKVNAISYLQCSFLLWVSISGSSVAPQVFSLYFISPKDKPWINQTCLICPQVYQRGMI